MAALSLLLCFQLLAGGGRWTGVVVWPAVVGDSRGGADGGANGARFWDRNFRFGNW
ncbi:hypothetical protein V6Z11_D01G246500 [Gossypium hirsutum]